MGEMKIIIMMIGILVGGAFGVKQYKEVHNPGLFWKSGTSWVHPDNCLVCGGKCHPLEKRGMKFQKCDDCGREYLVPQKRPAEKLASAK